MIFGKENKIKQQNLFLVENGKKLELKEMLYIRKYKPSLNVQKDSQLFTFIIRNSKQENDKTRDFQKYSKKKQNNYKRK